MQGHQGAIGSFPDTLDFELGSTSTSTTINQQILWNNLSSAEEQLPDFVVSPIDANITYMNSICHEENNLGPWSLGEPNSSANTQHEVSCEEPEREYECSSSLVDSVGGNMRLEEGLREPVNLLSNFGTCQNSNCPLLLQSPNSSAIMQNLNINVRPSHSDSVDDSIIGHPFSCESAGSVNEQSLPVSSPFDPFESNGCRRDGSLPGHRLSCKRKSFEGTVGQSSVDGSSNFQHSESNLCHVVPPQNNASVSLGITTPTNNNHGVGIARPSIGTRNVRRRVNPSHNQDSAHPNIFPRANASSHLNISSPIPSVRFLPVNHSPISGFEQTVYNTNSPNHYNVVGVPSIPQSGHSFRWSGASSSRYDNLSSRLIFNSGNMPINSEEHSMPIAPTTQSRNLSQSPTNLDLTSGNISIPGNVSSSRRASRSGVHSSSVYNRAHHSSVQFPRSLSEMVRRSLLSSVGLEPDGLDSNQPPFHSGPSVFSQEMVFSSGAGSQVPQQYGRSAMPFYRQGDGLLAFSYPMRNFSTSSERRRRLASEICNALDLVRRGEGVGFEDHFMILDPSIFFAAADAHDRHRDMRLDVDNMSYEELLALEERIGNVSTGLSDESILKCLKQLKYSCRALGSQVDMENCCICQEEYFEGEIGQLECGHEFHTKCIKQWLTQKNLCPICKTAALKDI